MLLRKGQRILETGSDQLESIGLFLTDLRILTLTSFRLHLKHVTWLFHTEIAVNIKEFFLFFFPEFIFDFLPFKLYLNNN